MNIDVKRKEAAVMYQCEIDKAEKSHERLVELLELHEMYDLLYELEEDGLELDSLTSTLDKINITEEEKDEIIYNYNQSVKSLLALRFLRAF
ncbi:TPA: hypothetical protein RVS85_002093 [Pasteurella multocida]|nr:hypothetical protein [Pasteurella multocida]